MEDPPDWIFAALVFTGGLRVALLMVRGRDLVALALLITLRKLEQLLRGAELEVISTVGDSAPVVKVLYSSECSAVQQSWAG
jgi:hypothetical protein